MKRSIYIVDDQPEVLEIATVIVRSILPEADVIGFNSPCKALEAAKASPPDLILSDQLMPEMSGAELLEQTRLAAPGTLRIIMSGFVALDKLTMITCAHQYVAKPFDVPQLKKMLDRTFAAQERVKVKELQRTVASLRSLPSLPQVHQSLMAELKSGEGASSTVGQIISQDAGLSAKVLQLANSPLFGRDYLVTSPEEAVLCLGINLISAIVLSQSLFKHFKATAQTESSMGLVWSHCWETAALAQCYCREHRLPRHVQEESFLAGLLHETGRLILIDNFPTEFRAACQAAQQARSPLGPKLREQFGAAHCEIAAYLLDLWGMPDAVVTAISQLDRPEPSKNGEFTAASALYIADRVASRGTPPDAFPPDQWNAEYVRSVGGPDDIRRWLRSDGKAE